MAIQDDIVKQVPCLRRYARALLGDLRCADDLVHDTLERSLRYATQFRAGTNLRRWLMTIMHNVFVNNLRKYSQLRHAMAYGLPPKTVRVSRKAAPDTTRTQRPPQSTRTVLSFLERPDSRQRFPARTHDS